MTSPEQPASPSSVANPAASATSSDTDNAAGAAATNSNDESGPNDSIAGRRVYLVTGATGGLGTAVSHSLVQRGYDVVLVSKTVQRLETLYDELHALRPDSATILPVDLGGATVEDYQNIANTCLLYTSPSPRDS